MTWIPFEIFANAQTGKSVVPVSVNTVWSHGRIFSSRNRAAPCSLPCGVSRRKVGVRCRSSAGGEGSRGASPVSHRAGQPCGGDPSHGAGAAGLRLAPRRTGSVIISKLPLLLSPELFIFRMGVSRECWPHPERVSAQYELRSVRAF